MFAILSFYDVSRQDWVESRSGIFQKVLHIDVKVYIYIYIYILIITCGFYSYVYMCKLAYFKMLHYYQHKAVGVEMSPEIN